MFKNLLMEAHFLKLSFFYSVYVCNKNIVILFDQLIRKNYQIFLEFTCQMLARANWWENWMNFVIDRWSVASPTTDHLPSIKYTVILCYQLHYFCKHLNNFFYWTIFNPKTIWITTQYKSLQTPIGYRNISQKRWVVFLGQSPPPIFPLQLPEPY